MKIMFLFFSFLCLNPSFVKGSDTPLVETDPETSCCCSCFHPMLNAIYSFFRGSSAHSEIMLLDLVNARLGNEALINSTQFKFAGNSQLSNFQGSSIIKGNTRVLNLFAPKKSQEEVRRLTAYEKVEIVLDTTFGLKSGQEGLPPPAKRDGSIHRLLRYKFDFVFGPMRNGWGQRYGHNNTSNHFADNPDCQGVFPGIGTGMAITVGHTRPTDFFSSYHAETDYERLRVLLDVLTVIRKI